jgi:hypothetical protein
MAELAGRELLLATLVVVVAALFVVTLVFSFYAIGLRVRHQRRDRVRAEFSERWSAGLLTAIGDPSAANDLMSLVAPEERLDFVGFAVQYARRVRADGRMVLRALVRPYMDLVVARSASPSVEVRARAIQTLGTLGLPEHGARVAAALDDPSPLVAMVAARALALEESPAYAQAVLARLPRFQGWNRRFLASMLAAMGPKVSETLRAGLADPGRDTLSRAVLAEALQIQGDLLAGDVAAEILEGSLDRELLASALRLLREVGRPEHRDAVRALCGAPDEVVRAQALRTLGAVGDQEDVPQLLEAMRDESPWAALNAARGARAAGGAAALGEIAASDDVRAVLAKQVLTEDGSR